MADFNVDLSKPNASGARPIAPVHDARTEFPNPWIGFGLGIAEALVKNQGDQQKKEAEAREAAVIENFTKEQTALNDALLQGSSVSQVNARAMANFSKYSAAFPTLVDKFTKTNKSLFEHTQLGVAQSEIQMVRDAEKALIGEAVKNGVVITEDMPPSVKKMTLDAYRTQKMVEANLDRQIKLNTESRAQNNEERTVAKQKLEQSVVAGLAQIGDAYLPSTLERAMHIADNASKTGTDGTQKLEELFMPIMGSITALGSNKPELIKPYKDLFEDIKRAATEKMQGKLSTEQSDNQLKLLKNKIEMMSLAAPENKAIYGASKLFGGTIPATYLETNQVGKGLISRLSLSFIADSPTNLQTPSLIGTKSDPASKKTELATYDMIKNNISLVESGKAPDAEGVKTQVGNLANHLLTQVGSYAERGIPPSELADAYNFLASSDFKKIVEYGKVDAKAMQGASRVFGSVFKRDIVDDMAKKLDQPFRSDGTTQLTFADLVDFKWDGAGVVAMQTNIADKNTRLTFMETEGRDVFKRDMDKAAAALNKLVKAGAHMEGHSNYTKYWEENKHNLLPNIYPPENVKPNSIHEIQGKKFKYTGGTPWRRSQYWEEVKSE